MFDDINVQRQCQTCLASFPTNEILRAHLDAYKVSPPLPNGTSFNAVRLASGFYRRKSKIVGHTRLLFVT